VREIKGEGSKPRIIKNGGAKREKGQEKQGLQYTAAQLVFAVSAQ
jgi:hypothetical protein